MSNHDLWLQTDTEGERQQAAAEYDAEKFTEWLESASEAEFEDHCRDFLFALKKGTTLTGDGWQVFDRWIYENRWTQRRKAA